MVLLQGVLQALWHARVQRASLKVVNSNSNRLKRVDAQRWSSFETIECNQRTVEHELDSSTSRNHGNNNIITQAVSIIRVEECNIPVYHNCSSCVLLLHKLNDSLHLVLFVVYFLDCILIRTRENKNGGEGVCFFTGSCAN